MKCGIMETVEVPLMGIPVYYRRCKKCEFLFTDAFDDWSQDEFKQHIYNERYLAFDPNYEEVRPRTNLGNINKIFSGHKDQLRILDFGGGNGRLAELLRNDGYKNAATYDPFVPEFADRPAGKFNLLTCFEVLEHLPQPMQWIEFMVESADDPGAIYFSTVQQPDDVDMGWWYISPRCGHISLWSRKALAHAWGTFGYNLATCNAGIFHIAYKKPFDFLLPMISLCPS